MFYFNTEDIIKAQNGDKEVFEKILKEKSTNKWTNDKNYDEWNGKNTITKTNKSNDETNEQIYVIK